MTAYPLLQILLYLSLLFAPADAKKITINGPDSAVLWELKRDDRGWQIQPQPGPLAGNDSRGAYASISLGHVILKGAGWQDDKDVQAFVAGAEAGHDWSKEAVLLLTATTSLEKDGDWLLFRLNRGDRGEKTYRILYDPPAPRVAAAGPITVNVLGEVKTPGAYPLPAGSTLVDAIAAAGGWVSMANLRKVSLLHGKAGEVPKLSFHNLQDMLEGKVTPRGLEDHDTIYVTVRLINY